MTQPERNQRRSLVIQSVGSLLKQLGVDLEDENFKETPRRFGDYLLEHFVPAKYFNQQVSDFGKAVFPTKYKGMVVQTDVHAYGICPHHLLPILYTIDLAYIPTKKAVGLSKLARLASACLNLPVLQEDATEDLTAKMSDLLKTEDVAAVVVGKHMCMSIRGVRAHDAKTITTSLRGVFMNNEDQARGEFLAHVHSK